MPNKLRKHYRAVFTSDWHLGFRDTNVKQLLAFLESITCDYLYLVGDIPDIWEMVKRVHWDATCTAILRRVLGMSADGTKVVWTPGNHDEAMRPFLPIVIGQNIRIVDEIVHHTLSGKAFMVIHGDQFDFIVGKMKWLAKIGGTLYGWLIPMNRMLHVVRVKCGFTTYWSLSGYLKSKAKRAASFTNEFAEAALKYAASRGCDGVICGHIHKAALYPVGDLQYANCGDWVESMTAIVENDAGELEQLLWYDPTAEAV